MWLPDERGLLIGIDPCVPFGSPQETEDGEWITEYEPPTVHYVDKDGKNLTPIEGVGSVEDVYCKTKTSRASDE